MLAFKNIKRPLLVLGVFLITATISVLGVRWDDVKGSYLVNEKDYASTQGVIISSGDYTRASKGNNIIYYYDISYSYSVNNHQYSSNKINFLPNGSNNINFVNFYKNKYPKNCNVTVYYLINNPAFSVLDNQTKDKNIRLSAIYILAGILLCLRDLYNQSHKNKL